ncbi:hypothetical protein N7603_03195 [Acholeplasma vituli]|uniref:DUF4179 domain-containing protein n=1 Tax=Paracholeplasma vituli TaxID=69473 RepID=A0ABT2PY51_9MOLU|nr:hypothetical protein [Paracholeplasma vituli]MCU0104657.1 hypothetical protein [Paracholeplasma vituli]
MNDKDIQKLLKSTIDTQVPNVLSKIDLKSIEILAAPEPIFQWRLRRVLPTALLALTSLVILFVLISLRNPNSETPIPMRLTAEKTYSFSAISSSVLLNTVETQVALSNQMILLNSRTQGTYIKNRMTLLNPYFNMIEIFISNQELSFSDPKPSDLEGYSYQITYQVMNLNQETESYEFHYRINIEDGIEYTEGVLVLDTITYYLEGSKAVINGVTTIQTFTYVNVAEKELNYIEFKSIESLDEQQFNYKVYHEGNEIEQTKVQLETFNRLLRIKLEYENLFSNVDVELKANRIDTKMGPRIRIQYEYKGPVVKEEGMIILSLIKNEITGELGYAFLITNSKGEKDTVRGSRGQHNSNKQTDK